MFSLRLALVVASASLVLWSSTAHALVFRAYLSEQGNDANPCTLPLPCRLLPAALTQVQDGGEVWILDSANFNTTTVTVNKSVTILAVPGAGGSFVTSGADALVVNGSNIRVQLRNLVFVNPSAGPYNGVSVLAGAWLTVEDSHFSGLGGAGVYVNAVGSKTQIYRSSFTANGAGVRVLNGRAHVTESNLQNNTIAIHANGNGGAANNPINGTTIVRVKGGNVIDNGTAFYIENSGIRNGGSCNGWNIFLFFNQGGTQTTVAGNTTWVTAVGTSDLNAGCSPGQFDVGGYGNQNQ